MMVDLANDNDIILHSGSADVYQETDNFSFKDDILIGVSNKTPTYEF